MAGKEIDPSFSFVKFFAKLMQRAEKARLQKGTKFEDEGKKRAERVAKLSQTDAATEQQSKDKAKDVAKKLRSKNRVEVEAAEAELKATGRVVVDTATALDLQREAIMVARVRGDVPKWLTDAVPVISYSDVAAELVSQISFMSHNLRDDPYVLYEAMRRADLVFDLSSATTDALVEYVNARKVVELRIRQLVAGLSGNNPTNEYYKDFAGFEDDGIFGHNMDLYKSVVLAEAADAGEKPDKKKEKVKYKEWQEKRTAEKQRHDLMGDLQTMQDRIDRGFLNKEEELRTLEDFERRLESGLFSKFDQEIEVDKSIYDKNDALPYIDRLKTRRRILQAEVNKANQEARGYNVVTFDEVKHTMVKEDWPDDWRHKDPFYFQSIKDRSDVRLIISGRDGEKEYFDNLITKIYGLGKEPGRPSFPQQGELDEFERYLHWKYRKREGAYAGIFKYIQDNSPRMDQIMKNLLFTPGDPRDKIKNIQFLTGADMDHFMKNYDFSNFAWSFMEESLFDRLSERTIEYREALAELMDHHHQKLSRYFDLRRMQAAGTLNTAELERELAGLQLTVDKAGYAVMLWDSDIQNFTELDLEIGNMQSDLVKIQLKNASGVPLSDWEKERLKYLPGQIERKMQARAVASELENGSVAEDLTANRGLSPIDVETKIRLKQYLDEVGIPYKEWQLNRAVWAARQAMIGSARMIDIGAQFATRPAIEFWGLMQEEANAGLIDIGKYVMRSPAFEDFQRLINPDLFDYRFNMGGERGQIDRALLHIGLLERKGYEFKNAKKYRRPEERELNEVIRKGREFIRQVEDETGIPQTELILNGFYDSGGIVDKTLWRFQLGGMDPLQQEYTQMMDKGLLGVNPRFNNQALGVRYQIVPGTENGPNANTAGKVAEMRKMVQRNPSKLLHFMGEPLLEIYNRYHIDAKERMMLHRALSASTVTLYDTERYINGELYAVKDVNLVENLTDFNTVLRPFLEKQGMSSARAGEMYDLLHDAYLKFTEERKFIEPGKKYEHRSMLEAVATLEAAFTPTLSDFDMKKSSLFLMGTIGQDRRGRDMWAMARGRDAWLKLKKPEMLSPQDPKETIKLLYEFREAMNEYTTGTSAEKATYQLVRKWFKFNENRMNYNKWLFWTRWVPGLHPLIKTFTMLDTRHSILKWAFGKKGEELPREIATKLALSLRYHGVNTVIYKEKNFDHIIDEFEKLGMFTECDYLYHALRKEFHATTGYQIYGVIADNWWIAPLLAAGMGVKQGVEEDEKSGGGGGHH